MRHVVPSLFFLLEQAERAAGAGPANNRQARRANRPEVADAEGEDKPAPPSVADTFGSPIDGKGHYNRFLALYPIEGVSFKATANSKPFEFDSGNLKGTKQTRMADCIIEQGKDGYYGLVQGAAIAKREYTDGSVGLVLQWPSSGGSFKRSMISVAENEKAAVEFAAYEQIVIGKFMEWRRAQRAAGLTSKATTAGKGARLNADELADLDL